MRRLTSDPTSPSQDGPIILSQHDSAWSIAFDLAARELTTHLDNVLVALHHVGSTSIAGIAAKPIIDILAVVTDFDALDGRNAVFTAMGYDALGQYGIPHRRYFRRNSVNGVRTHHLHAFLRGHEQIERMLLFRDYLRATPEVARQYEALKYELAARSGGAHATYAASKTDFVNAVLIKARTWANASRNVGADV